MMKRKTIFVYFFFVVSALIITSCQSEQAEQKVPEGFEVNPAFDLELVAGEPLVLDPVDIEFDENGHAYVLEMPGYPLHDEESRLIYLEDEDQDGFYDKRHVYADKLSLASSFMPYKGGMLVAAPPNLLWLKDNDGDHKAEEREVIMSGFPLGNLQHNYNGLTYGLDNWIYAGNGGNSGTPYFVADSTNKVDLRGADFRFQIEGNKLARVGESSGGFELAFDNWGHMFETHNLEHVSQLVFEEKYTKGLPIEPSHSLTNISDHEENGLSRIYPIGEQETRVNHPEQSGYFSGACGITFYGGNAFPEGYNNNIFVCDVVLNLLHMDVLNPKGSSFTTSRMREKADFLASTDRAFRPVNLTTGPDGAFYLVDMYRAVIEHPEWIPDELEKDLDLGAGKKEGRIYRITPKGKWQNGMQSLDNADLEELVKALGDKNQWTRLTAQRLLVQNKNEGAIALLENQLSNENPLARLHSLWTLEGMSALSEASLVSGLDDKNAGIRENALKIAEGRLNSSNDLIQKVISRITDDDPKVRMQAALTIGRLNGEAYKNKMEEIHDQLIRSLFDYENDTWNAMAIASAAQKAPLEFLGLQLQKTKGNLTEHQAVIAEALIKLIGKQGEAETIANAIIFVQSSSSTKSASKAKLVNALAGGINASTNQIQAPNFLSKTLNLLETNLDIAIIQASGNLRNALNLPVSPYLNKFIKDAGTTVFDDQKSLEERLELIQLIGLDDFENRADILYQLLDNRQPQALQNEAIKQLWEANQPSVAQNLLERWSKLGPETRKGASNILLYKAYNHDPLLTAIENGAINMGEMNFDLERRRVLLRSKNEGIKSRAENLFSDAGVVQRKEAMEKLRPSIAMDGDIVKGAEHYEMLCSQCHIYGEGGKDVGPVLTEISRKSKESLLHDIVDPNAAVDTKYLNYQIRTKDGNIHLGMVYQEDDNEITLRNIGGLEKTINKKEIEELTSLGTSLMPEGLESNMSPQDFADLLAFLQQKN